MAVEVDEEGFCSGCGNPVAGNQKFCMKCGFDLRPEPPQQPAPVFPAVSGFNPGAAYPVPAPQVGTASAKRDLNRAVVVVVVAVVVVVVAVVVAVIAVSGPSSSSTGHTRSPAHPPATSLQTPAQTTPPTPPTTTLPSTVGVPFSLTPLDSEGNQAMTVVQSLATALANHDWSGAEAIWPNVGDPGARANGYGALEKSTVVVTGESPEGATVTLDGAYVAWENVNGPRTSIYCFQWIVDTNAGQIMTETSVGPPHPDVAQAWEIPSQLSGQVQELCGG